MPSTSAQSDGLEAFRAESEIRTESPIVAAATESRSRYGAWRVVAAVAFAGAVVVVGLALMTDWIPLRVSAPQLSTLTVESRPVAADVIVDGLMRGASPLTLSLTPGAHRIALRHGPDERGGPLTLAAGASVTRYYEFATEPSASRPTAKMIVVTDPPSARVTIDGDARGTSPITIEELATGEHRIAVVGDSGSADRVVRTAPGETTSVVFVLPKSASPAAGWLAVVSPFDVRLVEGNSEVGAGRAARVMMTAGRHTIALVNDTLQFHDTRNVDVAAGKTMTIRVEAPKAAVSANARPWADVIVDGVNVGQTPISNLSIAIGQHDIVFRNPQLGERRQSVVITTRGPNRVAVDLTR